LIPTSHLPLNPFALFPSHHKFIICFNFTPKLCSAAVLISLLVMVLPHPSTGPLVSITTSQFITLHDVTFKVTILFYCFHFGSQPLVLREQGIVCLTMAILRVETVKSQHLLRSFSWSHGYPRRNVRLTRSYQSFYHKTTWVAVCFW
jgi:hypothetical protein